MFKLFASLLRDRAGNFGILTALLTVPLVTAVGASVDVSEAMRIKADIQLAADIAAVGSVSVQSPCVVKAMASGDDGELTECEQTALKIFKGNTGQSLPDQTLSPTISVVKRGGQLDSTISVGTTVPTTFLNIIGVRSIPISIKSTGNYNATLFQKFYVLLDNSPSMGVAATNADIATMVSHTGDSCAFACHIVSTTGVENTSDYYHLAKSLHVTTRIDVVAAAAASLMDTATNTRTYANQFGMGIYSFGTKAEAVGLNEVQAMTTNLDVAKSKAATVQLMTIPNQGYDNDMQTSFDSTIGAISPIIGTGGSGASAADAQKILFFVSDGVGDSNKPVGCTKPLSGSQRCMEPIDIKSCTALKAHNVKIAVLYTTYLPLPTNGWYNTWIKPFQSEIATKMQACASPNYFFEVGPSQGISEAMNYLFLKIVNSPRLAS